jgi:hypothetical protein
MGTQGIAKWTQRGAVVIARDNMVQDKLRCNMGVYFFDDYKDEYGCLYIQASTNIP